MGTSSSTRRQSFDVHGEVNLDHFQILRAIGKGSFGKVCIVQKKDTKKMFAMKYMNKAMCIEKDSVKNVMREFKILADLEHPFLVNLWFTFQDEEDMFMVVDLLMGGDLRYHIQQNVQFDETRVKLYICETALALDYLRQRKIVHRDLKPDNILLDEKGHVHLTDFNIATVLKDGHLATSMSGTKPYMAPEVFRTALEEFPGYSFPVDWWSLGVLTYEMLRGRRPYEIHGNSSLVETKQAFLSQAVNYSQSWEPGMTDILKKFLSLDPNLRISTLEELKKHPYFQDVHFTAVLNKEIKPNFVPSKDQLNCDPTFELEEMIIEAKPLHKKKKRLAKRNSTREHMNCHEPKVIDPMQVSLDNIDKEFRAYNRERREINNETNSPDLCNDAKKPRTAHKDKHSDNKSTHCSLTKEIKVETVRKLSCDMATQTVQTSSVTKSLTPSAIEPSQSFTKESLGVAEVTG